MAKIHLKYARIIFCDTNFKAYPQIANQIFITHVYDTIKNSNYTTSFTLMNGKTKEDYIIIFRKLKEHIP